MFAIRKVLFIRGFVFVREMIVYRYLSLRRHRQATLLCSATSLVRGRQKVAPSDEGAVSIAD